MYKINSYVMPIHTATGATVVSHKAIAMKQRVARLKRELSINLKASK